MLKPILIGAAMAGMMLWMLHEPIMEGSASVSQGALAFALAHVAVVMAGAALALFVPRVRSLIARHRPDLRRRRGRPRRGDELELQRLGRKS